MSALAAGLNGAALYEPFRPESSPRVARVTPVHGYLDLSPGAEVPDLKAYVDALWRGRELTRWSVSQTSLRQLRRARALVLKDVRICRALGWFAHTYPATPVITITRRPEDVVSSMLRAPLGWSQMPFDTLVPPAARALGVATSDLALRTDDRGTWLAAVWLADNVRAQRDLAGVESACSIGYEEMVADPERVLAKVAMLVPTLDVSAAARVMSRPSATASRQFGEPRRRQEDVLTQGTLRALARLQEQWPISGWNDA